MPKGSLLCPHTKVKKTSIKFREQTIRACTDPNRYEYSSIHNSRYRYRYEYSLRWCPSHLYH